MDYRYPDIMMLNMNDRKPKVTVVTVTYNCGSEVEDTINSVLCQDYPNVEYVIVDGGSTDCTLDVIGAYRDKIDVFVSEPDKGVYDAMNKAVRLASGEWVIFMNAGDVFASSDVLSSVFKDDVSSLKLIYGNTIYVERDGGTILHKTANLDCFKKALMMYQPFCHQSAFYNITDKSDCIYNLEYRICADYDLTVRYFKRFGLNVCRYVPIVVSKYKNFDGISSNVRKLQKESILISLRNHLSLYCTLKKIYHYIFHV